MSTKQDGQLVTLSTVQSLPVVAGCFSALIQAETADIRYTEDGTDPSVGPTGKLLLHGLERTSIYGDLTQYRFYDAGGTAKLNYTLVIDATRV